MEPGAVLLCATHAGARSQGGRDHKSQRPWGQQSWEMPARPLSPQPSPISRDSLKGRFVYFHPWHQTEKFPTTPSSDPDVQTTHPQRFSQENYLAEKEIYKSRYHKLKMSWSSFEDNPLSPLQRGAIRARP